MDRLSAFSKKSKSKKEKKENVNLVVISLMLQCLFYFYGIHIFQIMSLPLQYGVKSQVQKKAMDFWNNT